MMVWMDKGMMRLRLLRQSMRENERGDRGYFVEGDRERESMAKAKTRTHPHAKENSAEVCSPP